MEIDPHSDIQPISDNAGDLLYWGSATPAYTAHSIRGRPTGEELATARGGFRPAQTYFLQLPTVSDEVRTLADSLLGSLANPYQKASALVAWFQSEFAYTLELPGSPAEATLDHFLLRRRAGHCEYFSTAMAVLLRTQGILAREVNGFLGGEWSEFGDYLAVTQNQAHAWVEVWFPGYGWVPFDPTPAGTGTGFAETSWFWPGRFLFDAVQHRWNKWVLDYSFQTQFGLFQRARSAFSGGDERNAPSPSPGGRKLPGRPLWWVGALVLMAGFGLRASNRAGTAPQTARLFLRLRAAGKRAGVPGPDLHSPHAFIRYLEAIHHPGSTPARVVVEGYLFDRFSGETLDGAGIEEMKRALKRAEAALKRGSVPSGRVA